MELMLFDETKFNQAVKLASTLAKSTIVPKHFQGKAEDVFAALVLGAELGFQPMQSLQAIVMIQGQCTLKAQTQLALVRARCPKAIIQVEVDEKEKIVTCTIKRDENDFGFKSTWDMNKAKAMGLSSRDNWLKQPITMLRWRCVSEALRMVFPDVLQGIYATEEMEDLSPLRNDPLIDLQQAAREDADRMRLEAQKPEDVAVGPLFLIQNGSLRGTRLWELPLVEIDDYLQTLKKRTTKKKDWELELISVFESYLSNIDDYREMIMELQNNEG